MLRLDDFPSLERWFNLQQRSSSLDYIEKCTQDLCLLLRQNPEPKFDQYLATIIKFLKIGGSLSELLSFLQIQDFSLERMLMEIAESAAIQEDTHIVDLIQTLAESTSLPSIKFLAAWTCFNTNDLQGCLNHLEKIDLPTSASLTLQGQAMLEMGSISDAIQAFSAASRRDPHDPLPFFQLSKAEFAINHFDEAWTAIRSCQQLTPLNEEVSIFMSLISLHQDPTDPKKIEASWAAMKTLQHSSKDMTAYSEMMIDLAFASGKESNMTWIASNLDLKSIYMVDSMVNKLPLILRSLKNQGWNDAIKELLDNLTRQ